MMFQVFIFLFRCQVSGGRFQGTGFRGQVFWRIEISFQKSLYIDNQCFLYFSKKFLENFSRFWRIEITFQKSLYIDNQCFLYFSKKFLENFSRFWRIEIYFL